MKKSKTLLNAIFLAIFTVIKIIFNFIIVKVTIINYGSEINGFNNTVLSILNYLNLMEAGVGAATIYSLYNPLINDDRKKINSIMSFTNKFFKKIAIWMSLIMLVVSIVYPLTVKDLTDKPLGTYIIIVYAVVNISNYFYDSKYKLLYNANKNLYFATISDTISYTISRIAFIVACICKWEFYITISTLLMDMVIRMIITTVINKKYYSWIDLKEKPDKSIWNNSKNVFVQKIATLVFNSTDLILITNILGAKQASIYAVYNLVKNGLVSIMSVIENSPIASLGQAFSKNEEIKKAKENYHIFESISVLLTTVFTCCWMLLILPFIKLYTQNINDISYINVGLAITIGIQFMLTYYRMPQAVLANVTGLFNETKKVYLLEAIINLVISVLLIFRLNMLGVIIRKYSSFNLFKCKNNGNSIF